MPTIDYYTYSRGILRREKVGSIIKMKGGMVANKEIKRGKVN